MLEWSTPVVVLQEPRVRRGPRIRRVQVVQHVQRPLALETRVATQLATEMASEHHEDLQQLRNS